MTDQSREALEREEDGRLEPFAMRSARAPRRVPLEPEGRLVDYRTEFQRDRDRILHARAFRRLRLKSHGGAFPPEERYRDRLTHTMEVSQIGRTVARALGLNEDLVEAISLGHELGMPPFGRAGESALSSLLEGAGFRYNVQSLRVVDHLEKRYRHPGLNLTDATREGILKHVMGPGQTVEAGFAADDASLRPGCAPFFEAQVVAAVEEAASVVQDLDDGLRAGELDPAAVEALPIVRELSRRIGATPDRGGTRARRGELFMRANVVYRGLTHLLVAGIVHNSRRGLKAWAREHGLGTYDGYLEARGAVRAGTVGLSPRVQRLFDGLRDLVARRLHQGAWLRAVSFRARVLLADLFRALAEDPRLAEDYLLLRFREEEGGPYLRDLPSPAVEAEIARRYRASPRWARLVADHIAGMTDPFAVQEHARIIGTRAAGGAA